MRASFFLIFLIASYGYAAEQKNDDPTSKSGGIYKTVDENGQIRYSDSPATGAEKVELNDTIIVPGTKAGKRPRQTNSQQNTEYELTIQSPRDGTKVSPAQRTVTVTVALQRTLSSGHLLQLLVNGSPSGPKTRSKSMQTQQLRRGKTSLAVAVVDASGRVVERSRPVNIQVFRPNRKKN